MSRKINFRSGKLFSKLKEVSWWINAYERRKRFVCSQGKYRWRGRITFTVNHYSYECFASSLTAFSVMKLNGETSVWIKQYGLTPLISKFHEFHWKFFPKFPNFSVNNLRELKTASFPRLSVFHLADINKMAQECLQDPLKYAPIDFFFHLRKRISR